MKYNPVIVLAYWRSAGLPAARTEYRFHPGRKWRFDFAFTPYQVALEVQGGIFVHGRHTRGAAMLKEWEKINAAAVLGWRVLYCPPIDLCTEAMTDTIRAALQHVGSLPNEKLTDAGPRRPGLA